MGFRRKHLSGHHQPMTPRCTNPEIAKAFHDFSPKEDRITGEPGLDQLHELSLAKLSSEGYSGTFEAVLNLKAIRGCTIEISVKILDQSGEPLSVCSWKVGQEISFRFLKRLN